MAGLHDASSRMLYRIAGAALALIVALYLYEVTARYLFNAPTTWSGEAVQYCLSVLIFFALPEMTRRHGHVAIDIIPTLASEPVRHRLSLFSFVLAGAVCLVAGSVVGREALKQFDRGLMTNAAHPIPRWWISAVIALGLLSAGLHFLRALRQRDTAA